jgi:hypothetical protein
MDARLRRYGSTFRSGAMSTLKAKSVQGAEGHERRYKRAGAQ